MKKLVIIVDYWRLEYFKKIIYSLKNKYKIYVFSNNLDYFENIDDISFEKTLKKNVFYKKISFIKKIKKISPDIFFITHPKQWYILPFMHKVKIIYFPSFIKSEYIHLFHYILCYKAEKIIFLNKYQKEFYKIPSIFNKKVKIVPNYPDFFRKFTNNGIFKSLNIKRNLKKLIVFNGYITNGYSIDLILKTAKTLIYNPQIQFVFLGKDLTNGYFQRLTKNYNLDNVIFLRPDNNIAIYDYLKDASLGLFLFEPEKTKVFDDTTFYNFIMSSVPIISYKNLYYGDLINKYKLGKTLDARDNIELAKVILSIIYDHAGYPEYKQSCIKNSKIFSFEVLKEDLDF